MPTSDSAEREGRNVRLACGGFARTGWPRTVGNDPGPLARTETDSGGVRSAGRESNVAIVFPFRLWTGPAAWRCWPQCAALRLWWAV